jgi:hypothetical protein
MIRWIMWIRNTPTHWCSDQRGNESTQSSCIISYLGKHWRGGIDQTNGWLGKWKPWLPLAETFLSSTRLPASERMLLVMLKTACFDDWPVHLQVLRIKNRLTPHYDAAQSAVYRDVAINLRLTTLEARRLGVASHVCEVQIILKAYADLKVPPLSKAALCCVREFCARPKP